MLMYNIIEHSEKYSKTSGRLWLCCREEPDDKITDSKLFIFKSRFTGITGDGGTVDVEIAMVLKYLNSFWRILEII